MAYADYRHCDICDVKAFYDANLNYEHQKTEWMDSDAEPIRDFHGLYLERLGEWKVLCTKCAKTHKCVIVPLDAVCKKSEE